MSTRSSRASLALAAALSCVAGLTMAPPAHAAPADHLVINEVYGGGGNSGATFTHDFVEIANPTAGPVSLTGLSIAYYSASGSAASGSCVLSGTLAPGASFLVQQAKGAGGTTPLPTPDATCAFAMSGTSGSVALLQGGVTVDLVGYGSATKVETAAAPATTNATSVSRTGFADTDNNAADFTLGAPTPLGSGGVTPPPPPVDVIVPIAAIQGTGATTPLAGQTVTTRGVVTAAYPTGGFAGLYVQTPGSGGAPKPSGSASDGLFVYSDAAAEAVTIGDCVTVKGRAAEFNGLTQLTSATVTPASDCAPVVVTDLTTLPATDAAKEPYEGMLVKPLGTYTITNNDGLNQYGQLGLAVGDAPLYQATDVVAPGPGALAYEAANVAKYITLDDGSSWDYLRNAAAKNSPLPYLSAATPMRTASQVTFTRPVILDYRFQWNFQPTGQVVGATDADVPVASENDRETRVPAVGGGAQLAAFNVLNYFTDLGEDEDAYKDCPAYTDREGNPVTTNGCEVRGAWTASAFADQKAKIIAAINTMDAEAVALMEIENSGGLTWIDHQRDYSLAQLVADLNAAAGRTRWAYAESPLVTPGTEDVIRVAFVYDPNVVAALGPSLIDLDPAFANARYPLAQKFKVRNSGKPFVMVANHFKSKGSGADDGTGQGLSNPSREAQARQLTAWVKEMFDDQAQFLLADFNAYSRETPVQIIEAAGFTEVVKKFEPTSASYQFSGRLGSLDHVFVNDKGLQLVTGAAVWDINGDESTAFQYSRRNYNVTDFYAPDPFASSDHDPEVVGITTSKK